MLVREVVKKNKKNVVATVVDADGCCFENSLLSENAQENFSTYLLQHVPNGTIDLSKSKNASPRIGDVLAEKHAVASVVFGEDIASPNFSACSLMSMERSTCLNTESPIGTFEQSKSIDDNVDCDGVKNVFVSGVGVVEAVTNKQGESSSISHLTGNESPMSAKERRKGGGPKGTTKEVFAQNKKQIEILHLSHCFCS